LLDEPFGALDAKVRQELRQWIRRLHDEIHVTSIFVTHDQEEAFEVADRVVVMNHARIEQIGTPQEVYSNPATAFVYQFLGNVTTFRGTVRDEWFQLGETSIYLPVRERLRNGPAIACVRHHDVKVHLEPSDVAPIAARITHVNTAGSIIRIELERAGLQRNSPGKPLCRRCTRAQPRSSSCVTYGSLQTTARTLRQLRRPLSDASVGFLAGYCASTSVHARSDRIRHASLNPMAVSELALPSRPRL
jgi:sulfate transport system ATP-binding protein